MSVFCTDPVTISQSASNQAVDKVNAIKPVTGARNGIQLLQVIRSKPFLFTNALEKTGLINGWWIALHYSLIRKDTPYR